MQAYVSRLHRHLFLTLSRDNPAMATSAYTAMMFFGALNGEYIAFEKHVSGAKWDDNGFWDASRNRNLIYYMISGFSASFVFGIIHWPERADLVARACNGLACLGLHSPLC
jgi:hypothetical protein